MAGHFTQVVWRDTKSVGVGYAQNECNGYTAIFVVANYFPPGNWMGEFEKEVDRPAE